MVNVFGLHEKVFLEIISPIEPFLDEWDFIA